MDIGAILIVAAVLLAAIALAIRNQNQELHRRFLEKTKREWGARRELTLTQEAYEEIRRFSKETDKRAGDSSKLHRIDDITWNDCDMDRLYASINRCLCSAGDDVLYSWLRHPLLDEDEIRKRGKLIDEMAGDETARLSLMQSLFKIGRHPRHSLFADCCKLQSAEPIGRGSYLFFGLLTVALLILLFFHPVAAVILLVPDLIINIYLELSQQRKLQESIRGVGALARLLGGAKEIADRCAKDQMTDRLGEIVRHFSSFQKWAIFITVKGSVSSGLFSVVMEYLNLFFHFDLLAFDRLLAAYRGHESEVYELTEIIGTLDAAVSVASYRASLPYFCKRQAEQRSGELCVQGLYHPLLEHPVANDITTCGGNLITGANASGKSTFLKSVVISAILAQSIDTVPAASYQGELFRVYTSMALNDSLQNGESYFMVEIRSLKRIMDAISDEGQSHRVLAVIDEVLRGTNTIERIASSARLLQECVAGQRALIFAATHDIELTQMLQKHFKNYHFSGKVVENDVQFDYRIKNGPTTARNAIALLRAAGYDKQVAQEAEALALHFEQTGEWMSL